MTGERVVHHGDCRDVLAGIDDCSIDAVVTDPPYGLEFMGKDWDSFSTAGANYAHIIDGNDSPHARRHSVSFLGSQNPTCRLCGGLRSLVSEGSGGRTKCRCAAPDFPNTTLPKMRAYQAWCEEWAVETFRVLKPGGHLLAFGGTRTYHRLVCAIEDSGFEIRDCIHWVYGTGFPKSLDVRRAINAATDERWDGWGTALKPAHEPIVVARKPLIGSVADNVLLHGTGALNIGATRVEGTVQAGAGSLHTFHGGDDGYIKGTGREYQDAGRWPTNLVFSHDSDCGERCTEECPVAELDRQTKGDGASRFFPCFRYEGKASTAERLAGLSERNPHPTLKPVELVRWLIRLVCPPGGTILDPFAGSGSTLVAAALEDVSAVGVEKDADYVAVAEKRVAWAEAKPVQSSLFDGIGGGA